LKFNAFSIFSITCGNPELTIRQIRNCSYS